MRLASERDVRVVDRAGRHSDSTNAARSLFPLRARFNKLLELLAERGEHLHVGLVDIEQHRLHPRGRRGHFFRQRAHAGHVGVGNAVALVVRDGDYAALAEDVAQVEPAKLLRGEIPAAPCNASGPHRKYADAKPILTIK